MYGEGQRAPLREAVYLAIDRDGLLRRAEAFLPAQQLSKVVSIVNPDVRNPKVGWDTDLVRYKEKMAEAGIYNGIDIRLYVSMNLQWAAESFCGR